MSAKLFGRRLYAEAWERLGPGQEADQVTEPRPSRTVVAQLRGFPTRKPELRDTLRIEADYFERNRERMRHHLVHPSLNVTD